MFLWMAAILGSSFAIFIAWIVVDGSGCMMRVPNERNLSLVGTWVSDDYRPSMVLRKDGTGMQFVPKRLRRNLAWGSSDGHLFNKHFSTDAWVLIDYRYELSTDGKTLHLSYFENPKIKPRVMTKSPY